MRSTNTGHLCSKMLGVLTLWSQSEVLFLKIHILCDLHVEFGDFVPPVVDADIVVLAGDVHVKNRGLQWIFDQKFEIPVLYVLGNHEFYREKFPGLIDKLKMGAEGTNVRVLENDSVEIGGYRFFGCTLWSDMEWLSVSRPFPWTWSRWHPKRWWKSPAWTGCRWVPETRPV